MKRLEEKKDKRIYVRISKEEYKEVSNIAIKNNVGISEIVREGIQQIVGGHNNEPKTICKVATLLSELESEMCDERDINKLEEVGMKLWKLY